ncbi:MAG: acyl-CoA thioesterase [Devosia sp.]|jgi:4-hydroxybenzoyl-CoA thioesterase|uniref:acyl-CoA thioesterase n=1 Tax=unclassified Devosia TaxID=196773 RepID=UPI0019FCCE49|nr:MULTISPECIES: thioesterase family protein [unclassified Devosia]MBF0680184.1 acyl-CoA thioesterase [Devosia sp.]WEJ34943.1 acyl-CoA thioesterase [Devosia sp. SD17-2]
MFTNTTSVTVQFGDCDPAGIVYYPNYFRMFDNATGALLSAALGMNKRQWLAHYDIAGIPMVDTGAQFFMPASFGDVLEIRSEITELGRSSFSLRHTIMRETNVGVEACEKRVWTRRDETGSIRSAPLPDDLRKRLSE